MFRPTRLEIEIGVLKNNLRLLRQWNGEQNFFCPMVKANAYGHGDILVARAVQEFGANAIGVALIEEAVHLRKHGIELPILCFAPLDVVAADAALEFNITPVVGRFEDFAALRARPTSLHLKFNTGMNRLGFDAGEIPALQTHLHKHQELKIEGVCTHLTHGDEIDQPEGFSRRQIQMLQALAQGFPGVRHAHKSASLSTLARQGLRKNDEIGARPGISIYGIPHDSALNGPGLRPILTWKSQLIRTHVVEKGSGVSYAARWVAARRSTIGIIPVGYGDGYNRCLSNQGQMLYRERRVPVVGSVCMDYILLDLTDAIADGSAKPGEEVVLLGAQGSERVTAEELARCAGTIAYEIVTAIGSRVAREAL